MSPPLSSAAFRNIAGVLDNDSFRRLLRRTTLTLLLALLAPTLVLTGVAFYLRNAAHWLDHTDQVIAEINHVEKTLVTMQSDFRGYRLRRDPEYLAAFVAAHAELRLHLDSLTAMIADNPRQVAAAQQLRAESERWMQAADDARVQMDANPNPEGGSNGLQASRHLMSAAVGTAHDMLAEEARLRALRTTTHDRVFATLVTLLAVAAGLGIPLLSFWVQRLLRELTSSYQASLGAVERRATELQVTLNSIGDAVIATDAAGRVDFLNPAAEKLLGWTSAESRGRALGEIFPIFSEETGAAAENPVGRVLRENVVVGLANHTVLRSRNGQEYPIEDSAAPIRDADGAVLGVILVFHDVTENRAAERQLRDKARIAADSAERFRLLSEVVALQVWTATPAGELDYANQECVKYFGGDLQHDILGNAWAQYVQVEDLPATLVAWQHALATGDRYEREFRLRGKDGRVRWFLVRAQAMRDLDGRIIKWFGSNTDIDELKRARDKAERASQAKDDFLAALSHELRTPLTPVLMIAESLREDERLPADVREQLGAMERNITLEARLIDDLLDLTAISRGKLQFHAELCDAHSLIGLAIEIVRNDASAKGVTIDRHFTAVHSGVVADPARFQQVIWNLLRNAVKFTPRHGRISVVTRELAHASGAPWLRVEVSDTGVGIDPALLEQIFLPFDQGGLTGDHRFGGIGLGLTIARAVMDLHGGRISAESAGANHGAKFIVELPSSTEPPTGRMAERPAKSTAAPAKSLAPLRLLLVEDHENTLETLQRLLQRRGHHVTTANTVAKALAAAAAEKFDLVISDLGLPDGTGIELMEKLRDTHGLRGIALSGYGMEEDVARSRAAGFLTHLVKPVHFPDLYRVISTLPPA